MKLEKVLYGTSSKVLYWTQESCSGRLGPETSEELSWLVVSRVGAKGSRSLGQVILLFAKFHALGDMGAEIQGERISLDKFKVKTGRECNG